LSGDEDGMLRIWDISSQK